jgi:hypothetical protein
MRMSGSTAALVALEDLAPDAMFATMPGTGIPLWPLLRWPMSTVLSHTQYETELAARREGTASKAARFARTALPSRDWSRRLRGRRPVLFAGPGSRNVPSPTGWVNPLLGPFAAELGADAAMLQYEPIPRGRRHAFEPTVTFEDAVVASELRARLAPPRATVIRAAREVAEDLFARVDHPIDARLRAIAMRTFDIRVRRAASLAASYERLLDRVAPRLLILQAAAYGDRSMLVSAAHDRGILVAEPQHGWLGGGHGAYNFGAAARDPRLRTTLPDTLLTFGLFWSQSVTVPFETVEVGKPSLDDASALALPLGDRPTEVLVISSAVNPDEAVSFVLGLRDAVPAGWTVVFRPHPQERTVAAQRYANLQSASGVRIDDEPDPYRSFGRARMVIGSNSTALYEAIALGTPVVIRESSMTGDYVDPEIFTNRFGPDQDASIAIRRAIDNPEISLAPELVERVWASGSRERFRRWADSALATATTKELAS